MSRITAPGTTSQQLVLVTKPDSEKLKDALVFVKAMSARKADKKRASEILIKLDRLDDSQWTTGKKKTPKQISLKPAELRMIGQLRDVYDIKLDFLGHWHIPQ